MGYDATCTCIVGKQSYDGKAQLETDFLQFRSESLRWKAPFTELAGLKADGENMEFTYAGKKTRLLLGEKTAARWAAKILNPPGRMDKLGVKPDARVFLEGTFDAAFVTELGGRVAGSIREADLVFFAAPDQAALRKTPVLAGKLAPTAALWIVYPKGRTEIREMDVLTAGRASGLKDVKVMRFSDVETALKFVIPAAARKQT